MNSNSTTEAARENAARWVPEHPKALCRDFASKPAPTEFWCVTCGWNQPMHDDEAARTAIADELARLVAACAHRAKVRLVGGDARLWECVRYDAETPGCGVLLTVSYGQHGEPTWTPADTAGATR